LKPKKSSSKTLPLFLKETNPTKFYSTIKVNSLQDWATKD